MQIKRILKIMDGKLLNLSDNLEKEITNFELDSRKIKKGDCFIAINKGNNYIKDVINKVSLVITEEDVKIKSKTPIMKVQNIMEKIQKLAREIRLDNIDVPLIAVTGSVGKTTTKELISSILSKKYNVLKNEGNENNHLGLPKTLLKLNNKHNLIILEMGMNHLGEIDLLSKIALPDIGVITSIGTAHIGNLKSQKNILKAKKEITNYMNNGILIVNSDDKYLKKLNDTSKYKVIKCGLHNSDLIISNIKEYNDKITFMLNLNNRKYPFIFNIPNISILVDVLLAIKIGLIFDVGINDIILAVNEYKSLNERMNIIKLNNDNLLIDDSYNASLESVKASLAFIKKQKQNKVIILGDILELGKYNNKIHKKIAKDLLKIKDSQILLVGNSTKIIKKIVKNSLYFDSNLKLKEYLNSINIENSIILIKASNAMNLKEIKNELDK